MQKLRGDISGVINIAEQDYAVPLTMLIRKWLM